MGNEYYDKLKTIMSQYAHQIYYVTTKFPKDELYGLTSQLRRSGLSVILNYIEGYSRIRKNVMINFLEISYGSLKESEYLIGFATEEKYLSKIEGKKILLLADQIGAMLWTTLRNLHKKSA